MMVAIDGTARLLDFGVAKATMAAHVTRDGTFKGKLAYSAPEQLRGNADAAERRLLAGGRAVGAARRPPHARQRAGARPSWSPTIMTGTLPTVTEALAAEREWLRRQRAGSQLEALEPIVNKGLAVDVARPLRDRGRDGSRR